MKNLQKFMGDKHKLEMEHVDIVYKYLFYAVGAIIAFLGSEICLVK